MDYCGRLNRLYKQVLPRACILPRDHYILAERVCDSEELIQSHLGEKGKTANSPSPASNEQHRITKLEHFWRRLSWYHCQEKLSLQKEQDCDQLLSDSAELSL